jgi:hypothetical protein
VISSGARDPLAGGERARSGSIRVAMSKVWPSTDITRCSLLFRNTALLHCYPALPIGEGREGKCHQQPRSQTSREDISPPDRDILARLKIFEVQKRGHVGGYGLFS